MAENEKTTQQMETTEQVAEQTQPKPTKIEAKKEPETAKGPETTKGPTPEPKINFGLTAKQLKSLTNNGKPKKSRSRQS